MRPVVRLLPMFDPYVVACAGAATGRSPRSTAPPGPRRAVVTERVLAEGRLHAAHFAAPLTGTFSPSAGGFDPGRGRNNLS